MSKRRTRRRFNAEFKARVALEAACGVKTVGNIADENERHPVQVSQWKKELLDSAQWVAEVRVRFVGMLHASESAAAQS